MHLRVLDGLKARLYPISQLQYKEMHKVSLGNWDTPQVQLLQSYVSTSSMLVGLPQHPIFTSNVVPHRKHQVSTDPYEWHHIAPFTRQS